MIKSVAIASDHGGFEYKGQIIEYIKADYPDITVIDCGCDGSKSVDYPDYAKTAVEKITNKEADAGILICGTGIGISIAANRHKNIRAALCTNATMARLTRQHNDANILSLGQRIIGIETAYACVKAFIETKFEGGRHVRRIEKIETQNS